MKNKMFLLLTGLVIMSTAYADHIPLDAKIYVAGHNGLVGSAIVRRLQRDGFSRIITRSHREVDLRNQQAVHNFFAQERPDYVFLAAAKVGGIKANMENPAEFLYDNLSIQTNVIHAAYQYGVKKLLFLGSSCIYPRDCPQPIKEDYLLASPLEETNKAYALAKITGLEMCKAYNKQYGTKFIACMPTNLYGPHDNFDLQTSHVLPALLNKLYKAKHAGDKQVIVWGTGRAYREFLYVDDLADATLFLMQHYDGNDIVNVGTGKDITIADLAQLVAEIVGFEGELVFDPSKPDGTPRKLLNVDKLTSLGWCAPTFLRDGIVKTLQWAVKKSVFDH